MAKIIALLLVCFATFGQTLSVINTGTTSNDGTGDSLRTAFTKANTNFYQLWSEVFTNIPVDITNSVAVKLDATNGTAVNLTGSLTNVSAKGALTYELSDESRLSANHDYGIALDVGLSSTVAKARIRSVSTIADLISVDPLTSDIFSYVKVLGYSAAGDGGGGDFRRVLYASVSGTEGEDGLWFRSSNNPLYAWQRVIEGPAINVAMFGAIPDDGTDDTDKINAAWRARGQKIVALSSGRYNLSGPIYLTNAPFSAPAFNVFQGAGTSDDGTELYSSDLTRPILILNTSYPIISGISTRFATRPTSANTGAVGLQITNAYNGTISDIYLKDSAYAIKTDSSGQVYSMAMNAVRVYGYAISGLYLGASGTPCEWNTLDIRNYPTAPTATGTIANSSTNVTISGLATNVVALMRVGQLFNVSGAAVSSYNGNHTLLSASGDTITYALGSAPSGPASGTATVLNYTGTSTGPAILTGQYVEFAGKGVRVEWNETDRLIELNGPWSIDGLHIEGFMGTTNGSSVFYTERAGTISGDIGIINSTIPAGATYAMWEPWLVQISLGSVLTRDNYYAGATWNWAVNGPAVADYHDTWASARWNRTGEFSNKQGANWGLRRAGVANDNVFFSLTGSADRSWFINGNSANIVVNTDLPNTQTPAPMYLQTLGAALVAGGTLTASNTITAQQTLEAGNSSLQTAATITGGSGGFEMLKLVRSSVVTNGIGALNGGITFKETTTQQNYAWLFSDFSSYRQFSFGSSSGSATPYISQFNGEHGVGTNIATGDMRFRLGLGTGNAASPDFEFYGGTPGASGSTQQSSLLLARINGLGGLELPVSGAVIELGNASDTTLARSAAGVVTIEGVTVAERPTTTALTYSGTNVTLTATSHVLHGNTLTLTNNCLLTITSSDGASGGITIVPHASTSYTVYLDSAIKLLGGGSSFVVTNSASETVNLEWKQTLRGGSSVILANKAVYP